MNRLQPVVDDFGWVDGQGSIDDPKPPETQIEFVVGEARDHPAIAEAVRAITLEDCPAYVEEQNRLDQARYEIESEYAEVGYQAFAEWSFELLSSILVREDMPEAILEKLAKRHDLTLDFIRRHKHVSPHKNVQLFTTFGRLYYGKSPHISQEEARQVAALP